MIVDVQVLVGAGCPDHLNSPAQVRRISRRGARHVSVGQPVSWIFIEFEVDDQGVADLAVSLSRSIEVSGAWYCDFHTDEETFVVLAGQISNIHVASATVELRQKHMVDPLAFQTFSWTGQRNSLRSGEIEIYV